MDNKQIKFIYFQLDNFVHKLNYVSHYLLFFSSFNSSLPSPPFVNPTPLLFLFLPTFFLHHTFSPPYPLPFFFFTIQTALYSLFYYLSPFLQKEQIDKKNLPHSSLFYLLSPYLLHFNCSKKRTFKRGGEVETLVADIGLKPSSWKQSYGVVF